MLYEEARKVRGRWQVDVLKTARTWVHSTTAKAREWQPRKFVAYKEVDVVQDPDDEERGGFAPSVFCWLALVVGPRHRATTRRFAFALGMT